MRSRTYIGYLLEASFSLLLDDLCDGRISELAELLLIDLALCEGSTGILDALWTEPRADVGASANCWAWHSGGGSEGAELRRSAGRGLRGVSEARSGCSEHQCW